MLPIIEYLCLAALPKLTIISFYFIFSHFSVEMANTYHLFFIEITLPLIMFSFKSHATESVGNYFGSKSNQKRDIAES